MDKFLGQIYSTISNFHSHFNYGPFTFRCVNFLFSKYMEDLTQFSHVSIIPFDTEVQIFRKKGPARKEHQLISGIVEVIKIVSYIEHPASHSMNDTTAVDFIIRTGMSLSPR